MLRNRPRTGTPKNIMIVEEERKKEIVMAGNHGMKGGP